MSYIAASSLMRALIQKISANANTLVLNNETDELFENLFDALTANAMQAINISGNEPLPFSFPNNQHNSDFMIFASAIVAPTANFVHGNPITWQFLDYTTSHGSSFFTSAAGNGAKRLQINFPQVKRVFFSGGFADEAFSNMVATTGPTTAVDNIALNVYAPRPIGLRLRGAGTNTWAKNGQLASSFDIDVFSTSDGGTSFNFTGTPALGLDYDTFSINYMGPNRCSISRLYSGLGAYNLRFVLRDSSGVPFAAFPTSSDEILISGGGLFPVQIFMDTYSAANPNSFMTTSSNIWAFGMFEAWMVAVPITTTSIKVKWQTNYPAATNYKIYRDTVSNFATQVLIANNTNGSFTDTGLAPSTEYFYKMVAQTPGDVTVTTFNCRTY